MMKHYASYFFEAFGPIINLPLIIYGKVMERFVKAERKTYQLSLPDFQFYQIRGSFVGHPDDVSHFVL